VASVGMRDGIPANRAGATLKPYDLALKAIIARQDNAATVQKREEIEEQFTLGLLVQVIRDAMLAEQLARKLAGVSVAGHTADDTISPQLVAVEARSVRKLILVVRVNLLIRVG